MVGDCACGCFCGVVFVSREQGASADASLSVDDHIFRWFNERYPVQMSACLADYADAEAAHTAQGTSASGQDPQELGAQPAGPVRQDAPDTQDPPQSEGVRE